MAAESPSELQQVAHAFLEPLNLSWLLDGVSPRRHAPDNASSGPQATGGAGIFADFVVVKEVSRGTPR